jgi:predicted phage terminase large subunit-like protein
MESSKLDTKNQQGLGKEVVKNTTRRKKQTSHGDINKNIIRQKKTTSVGTAKKNKRRMKAEKFNMPQELPEDVTKELQAAMKRGGIRSALHKVLTQRSFDTRVYDWQKHARRSQQIPTGVRWKTWLILAGRGFGKTRTGAETIRQWVVSGQYKRIALVGSTEKDVRQVMIEGPSGLLACHPPDEQAPRYFASLGVVIWPNGAIATVYTSEAYEKLRGPQFDAAWVDELGKFRFPQETWDQLSLALRLGACPRAVVTTTPRPIPLIRHFLKDRTVKVTRGSTFENKANLSAAFLNQIKRCYANTRIGAQEVYGKLLADQEGALWRRDLIQYGIPEAAQSFLRVVIAMDPATTYGPNSDETGIIVAGLTEAKTVYILADLSGRYKPSEWAEKVMKAYETYGADRVVAETNQGGQMIEQVLRQYGADLSFRGVCARRGKHTRAEPVVALYEQGRVLHQKPFEKLEDQLCGYVPGVPGKSPDRLDALVWALTDLVISPRYQTRVWSV